jgi:iron complex transport system ATP-binding protein
LSLRFAAVSFVRDGRRILESISWNVRPRERWVVLGPNGAGKTTILRMAGALDHPTDGLVEVLGCRLGRYDLRKLRERIGFVSGALARELRPGVRAGEVVVCGLHGALETWWHEYSAGDHRRAAELLEQAHVDPSKEWAVLSEGERQQTLLARALMTQPELLLLDEPFAGLDLAARERLLGRLDSLDGETPLVLVTHHVEEIPRTATHALLLRAGRIVSAGPVAETLTSETVSEAFDIAVRIGHDDGRWSATHRSRKD